MAVPAEQKKMPESDKTDPTPQRSAEEISVASLVDSILEVYGRKLEPEEIRLLVTESVGRAIAIVTGKL